MKTILDEARRLVIKLGTGILTSGIGELDEGRLQGIAARMAKLRERGIEVIVVSSGAIGLGMGVLKMKKRPSRLSDLQACAAVGQTVLMETWKRAFSPFHCNVAQVLLTHEDVRNRRRHVAAQNTLERLLGLGVVPVINENDTVSAD